MVALATNILPRWGKGARWYFADQVSDRLSATRGGREPLEMSKLER